jgi:hypothetical protein
MEKKLMINGKHWATYEYDIINKDCCILHLNVNKTQFKNIDSDLENFIAAIIGIVENIKINTLSYLNIKN